MLYHCNSKNCCWYGCLVVYIHIGVGSALLVSINWAMREPSIVRRVTGTGSHAFLIYIGVQHIAESGELIGSEENILLTISL